MTGVLAAVGQAEWQHGKGRAVVTEAGVGAEAAARQRLQPRKLGRQAMGAVWGSAWPWARGLKGESRFLVPGLSEPLCLLP